MAQPRETIEDFGLERNEREANYLDEYTFLIPFAGPMKEEADWQCLKIENLNEGIDVLVDGRIVCARDPGGLHQYAVHSPKQAYVVFTADLRETVAPFERRTPVRLWEMIVANWVHSSHATDSLRFVAFSNIINQDVRDVMREEWIHQIAQGQTPFGTRTQKMLTVTPTNSITWNKNYFIRTGAHIAETLSTPEKTLTLEKAHIIRRVNNERFIVLEFKNGADCQENHRQSPARQLQPATPHKVQENKATQSAGERCVLNIE